MDRMYVDISCLIAGLREEDVGPRGPAEPDARLDEGAEGGLRRIHRRAVPRSHEAARRYELGNETH